MICLVILLLALLVFVGFDLWASFYEWQSRIHIGRWTNRLEWQSAIESKARKWLDRSPTVKISDSNRWILYDLLRGKYRSKTIQHWQEAGLLFGLGKEASVRYALRKFDPKSGDWKQKPEHADAALLAYVLKKDGVLSSEAEKTVLDLLLALKKDQNTIPYRPALPRVRFVDTIGMTVPFLSLCGRPVLADAQIEEYDKARLPGSSIPAHAFNLVHNVPLGIYDWSRGIGWYVLGLIESNPDGRFNDRIVALTDELLSYQRPDGGFGAMFFNGASRFESSGSALIGLLMVKSFEINHDPRSIDAAFRVEKRLMAATRRSGALDYCQGDTRGIGYYSHTFSIMPFAQGIALRLSKELNRYANG